MQSPAIGPREIIYRDRYQEIYRVTADFGTFTKEYFVRDSGQRAGVVVVKGEAVLLVRQYRLLIDDISWEIPGGRILDGETPESAAIRECLEEADVLCRDLKPLISFHLGLDILHNPTHVFYTNECMEVGATDTNPRETIERAWIPLRRCIDMIFAQTIVDSFSIIALLSYGTRIGNRRG